MIKREELSSPESCMSRAYDEEMTFVLLARDPAAPGAIRHWALERIAMGKNKAEDPQIIEAVECARKMEEQRESDPKPWKLRAARDQALCGCGWKGAREELIPMGSLARLHCPNCSAPAHVAASPTLADLIMPPPLLLAICRALLVTIHQAQLNIPSSYLRELREEAQKLPGWNGFWNDAEEEPSNGTRD